MISADTSAILATADTDAAEHATCVEILARLQRPMLVSHMVIAETDYLLATRFGIPTANRFLADVARGTWELAESNAEDINDVITVSTRHQPLRLTATDCLNIVLAAHHGTTVLFTLDDRLYRATTPMDGSNAFTLLPAALEQCLGRGDRR